MDADSFDVQLFDGHIEACCEYRKEGYMHKEKLMRTVVTFPNT